MPPSAVRSAAGTARPGVVIFNWRDTRNPEGGGSERYVERVAGALAARGHRVTVFCAAHGEAPADELRDGVRFVRRGSRHSVYLRAAAHHLAGRLGPHGVVVDVQNGLPFFTPLFAGRPTVILVHHVHREQWHVVFGPVLARLGWWIESWLSPRLYRRCRYVAVSGVTRDDLVSLGVRRDAVTVVHNGTDVPPPVAGGRTPYPSICLLGRLVPHKRVELALAAAATLRGEFPGLRVTVVGHGYWEPRLRAAARQLALGDAVEFLGYAGEQDKHEVLARSWVLAMPSVKEGWGLSVMEAASHGTPSVAFRDAGGVAESIMDGETGLLAADEAGFTEALRMLLADPALRERLGRQAVARAGEFTWEVTGARFADVVDEALGSEAVEVAEPVVLRVPEAGGAGTVGARPGREPQRVP